MNENAKAISTPGVLGSHSVSEPASLAANLQGVHCQLQSPTASPRDWAGVSGSYPTHPPRPYLPTRHSRRHHPRLITRGSLTTWSDEVFPPYRISASTPSISYRRSVQGRASCFSLSRIKNKWSGFCPDNQRRWQYAVREPQRTRSLPCRTGPSMP
jgi:hypothetical protein